MVKLLYQNELGPGHMISDENQSLKRLIDEWESLPGPKKGPEASHAELAGSFSEPIGNGLVRVYLDTLNREELPLLNAMFCQTANHVRGSKEGLLRKLELLSSCYPDTAGFLDEYEKSGCPPISHSDTYRKAYHPAYRVVMQSHTAFLQLVRTLDALLQEKGRLIVAIEGNCASGKTTLSRLLSMHFDCSVIPMDDFFLPPELRTKERLAQPGGNVHYERFAEEIMEPLQKGLPVSYRPFSCRTMDYGNPLALPFRPITVVEGSYCMHPELRGLYDYSVFLSCPYEQQIERIRIRNGEENLMDFIKKWIPMENTYFETFRIKECCNLTIET